MKREESLMSRTRRSSFFQKSLYPTSSLKDPHYNITLIPGILFFSIFVLYAYFLYIYRKVYHVCMFVYMSFIS